MTAGFAGFISDSPAAIERFMQARAQYLPVLAFLARSAQYAEHDQRGRDRQRGDDKRKQEGMTDGGKRLREQRSGWKRHGRVHAVSFE